MSSLPKKKCCKGEKRETMTLVAAWIRKVDDIEELVVASDSRLRFGCAWDYSPKIMPLARGDSVLCFAGDTFYAYPMLIQLKSALEMNEKILSRAVDISDLRSYVISIIEEMRLAVHDLPSGTIAQDNDYRFILAGYSWKFSEFRIWHVQYQENIKKFSYRSIGINPKKNNEGRSFVFIGDHIGDARKRLNELVKSKVLEYGVLNWEPLEVLRDMSLNECYPEIGGAPQIIKIYKFMSSMPYNVYWPSKHEGSMYFGGRKLLPFEKNKYLTIDMETMSVNSRTSQRKEGLNKVLKVEVKNEHD